MIFKNILRVTIWNLPNLFFSILFPLLNKIYYQFRFKYKYNRASNLHLITSGSSQIYISRKKRLSFYSHGIDFRLKNLSIEYYLDQIEFKENDLVIDVGANIGEVGKYLYEKYKCKIFAFEPETSEFEALKKNLDNHKCQLFNFPLWNSEKDMKLYKNNDSGDTSLIENHDFKSSLNVKTRTLENILNKNYDKNLLIKLLKLEAEGAEPEILMGTGKWLDNIMYVTADCGPERGFKQEKTEENVTQILIHNSFEIVKRSNKRGVLLFKNKKL